MIKFIYRILLILFTLTSYQAAAQDDMFRKDRKRTWRRWRKNKQSYNPYLDRKAKNKPSALIAKGNRKELKRQKRNAKRQMRRSRRKVNK
jgi:hypothetical protein